MLDNAIHRRISILVYADMEAAFDYLVRVFRLGPGKLTRDGDGGVETHGWRDCYVLGGRRTR